MASKAPDEFIFHVIFEDRDDGGLRARSPEFPNFKLSHSDGEAVRRDVKPALEILLSAMWNTPISVRQVPQYSEAADHQIPLPHICATSYVGQATHH